MKSSENEDEDAEFPSKLEFSSNGTLIDFVDSQPPVTEINKINTLTKILQVLLRLVSSLVILLDLNHLY